MAKKIDLVVSLALIIFLIFIIVLWFNVNEQYSDCYNNDDVKDLFWENDTCYALDMQSRYDCQKYNRTAHKEFCVNLWGGEFE